MTNNKAQEDDEATLQAQIGFERENQARNELEARYIEIEYEAYEQKELYRQLYDVLEYQRYLYGVLRQITVNHPEFLRIKKKIEQNNIRLARLNKLVLREAEA